MVSVWFEKWVSRVLDRIRRDEEREEEDYNVY